MSKTTGNAVMDATAFLLGNLDINNVTKEVYPGDRFIESNQPFTIRVMDETELRDWRKLCNRTKIRKGQQEQEFDSARFQQLIIINCTVNPDFKNAEFIKAAGCTTSEQLLAKVLKPGERDLLVGEINALAGFEKTLDETKEEIKND